MVEPKSSERKEPGDATSVRPTMRVAHLTASPFLGGPERQMLGLASSLRYDCESFFLGFTEGGKARPFLDQARRLGFASIPLQHNMSGLGRGYWRSVGEVAGHLRELGADLLCCNGYKPDLVGLAAAHRVGIPVISVSRGWTAATPKVRLNEAVDRLCLRMMDRVVCVSEGQAAKIRKTGVPAERVVVCRNAIHADRFDDPSPEGRATLLDLFPLRPGRVVGAAGRLSPEKGFSVLVEAARRLIPDLDDVGYVIFGDGPLRDSLSQQIRRAGLGDRFVLAGFRDDLDRLIPHFDLMVLPSFTEGLPNVVLESLAAGVPVVATAVGGTPEVIDEGRDGYLVPPDDPGALARRILDSMSDDEMRREMGREGRERIRARFTFEAQADQYRAVFRGLVGSKTVVRCTGG